MWNTGGTDSCITTSLAGNYYLTVTDNNGCTAESNHLAVTVYPLPPVSISVNGDTLSVYNSVTQQWYRNSSLINGAINSIYITTQSGSYTVMVTDSNGCSSTSSAVVFSGIREIDDIFKIIVYPNPATSQLNITIDENLLGAQLNIYNTTGALVQSVRAIHESPLQLNISNLATGVYIAEVKLKDVVQRVRWVKM